MLHYIVQIVSFQLIFLLVYELFLKNETFFNYNRAYLLLTPVLAMVLPWLKFEFLVDAVPPEATVNLPEVFIGNRKAADSTAEVLAATNDSGLNWYLLTYMAGVAVNLGLFIKKYRSLHELLGFQRARVEKDFRVIEVPDSNIACTFFNTVLLGDKISETEKPHILSHELVHVKHGHSWDLIFFEIMKLLFWFNPLIYIYQSRIAGLHEFIADNEVVKNTERKAYYNQLLNTAFSTRNISFINQFFNHSLIKKRIIMLQKSKSKTISKFKFLLLVPALLLMLTYVACSEEKSAQDPEYSVQNDQYENLIRSIDSRTDFSEEQKEYYKEMVNEEMNSLEDRILRGDQPLPPPPPAKEMDEGAVPFAVIEQVPLFPGCEGLKSNEAQKKCMSEKISGFLNSNFDVEGMKPYAKPGVNRVIVKFRIDEQGNITDVASRAAVPQLEEEAERIVSSLPQMQPGEQDGQKISVMYSLPIVFKNGE